MNSSVVALISCMSSSDSAEKRAGGDVDFDLLLADPVAAHLEAEVLRLPGPDGAPLVSKLVCRCVLCVRADREPRGVRRHLDRVAELRGVDEGLAALGGRPPGWRSSTSCRPALVPVLETLKGGLSDAFAEGQC